MLTKRRPITRKFKHFLKKKSDACCPFQRLESRHFLLLIHHKQSIKCLSCISPKYEYITLIKQGRMKEMYFVVMVYI